MKPHADAALLAQLFPAIRTYQELASKHGIDDIFQDNGGKILRLLDPGADRPEIPRGQRCPTPPATNTN